MENVRIGKLRKQKRFLLMLPVLALPFVTMACWALGLGKGGKQVEEAPKNNGLNLELPSAHIKDDGKEDKLSFYEKAQKDDQQAADAIKNDPYYKLPGKDGPRKDSNELDNVVAHYPSRYAPAYGSTGLNASPIHPDGYKDPNEEKIMEKLHQLQNQIEKPQPSPASQMDRYQRKTTPLSDDVDRLEEMMNLMKDRGQRDPEMDQLEGMLDKVLDVQHPSRVQERIKEKSLGQKQMVFAVTRSDDPHPISLFGNKDTSDKKLHVPQSGFYGVDSQVKQEGEDNAIEAVVHETQTLVNGSVVKFRLLNDVYIRGVQIPRDNFVWGLASLNGERLQVSISSIRYGQSIFPTNLEVHDIDGLSGIFIPGAITRDVAKQSADNGIQGLGLATMNPSIGAQAASAGITAAKSLLSKKVKLVKVVVKAGYKVLLWDRHVQE